MNQHEPVRTNVLTRLLLVASLLAAMLVGLVQGASSASAISPDTYPSTWSSIPMDSTFDSWGEYNRECTSYVAWMLHSVNGFEMPFYDNASNWIADAEARGYVVDSSPAPGSVAASSTHVAWVEAIHGSGAAMTVDLQEYDELDSNHDGIYGDDGTYDERLGVPVSAYQYIHFKDLSTGSGGGATTTTGRLSVINGQNAIYARDTLTGPMNMMTSSGSTTQIAVGGNRTLELDSCGALWGIDGISSSGWTNISGCGLTQRIAVGSNGLMMLINACGAAWASYSFTSGWTQETNCGDALAIAVGGDNLYVINGSHNVYGKSGVIGPMNVMTTSYAGSVVAGSSGTVMITDGCGAAWANSTISTSGWAQVTGCGDAKAIAVGGANLYVINSSNTVYGRTGLTGPMNIMTGGNSTALAAGDNGHVMVIDSCGAAWANSTISTSGWAQVTGCGDAKAIAVG